MSELDPAARARLRWQCRRGMRELDVLLERWLEEHYDAAPAPQKAAFHALLELPDPQLAGYLLRGEPAVNAEAADVIQQILGQSRR